MRGQGGGDVGGGTGSREAGAAIDARSGEVATATAAVGAAK